MFFAKALADSEVLKYPAFSVFGFNNNEGCGKGIQDGNPIILMRAYHDQMYSVVARSWTLDLG
jgi:hypothetical protein